MAPPSAAPLKPRPAVATVEYAEAELREAIVSGRYKPGDRLIEMEISAQLQISRHPIREALRRLGREGLVTVRANRGAVVADIDPMVILEVYQIRAALGFLALRHVLNDHVRMPPATLRRLRDLAQKAQSAAAANRQRDMIKADLEFQAVIVDASNLPRVAAYFRALEGDIQRFNNSLKIEYPDKEAYIVKHTVALLHAVEERDLVLAQQIWHDKFVTAVSRFAALVPGAESWTDDPRWLVFKNDMVGDVFGKRA